MELVKQLLLVNWLINLRKLVNLFIWVLPILSVQQLVEQLVIWGETGRMFLVIKQKMGADPASVAFDTLSSAVANNADVVIIDTAGRLAQ